ncbi:hypothetical protein SeMB42_g07827 [Synchytrium endobioticum]|uniref:protein-tyrosine-phosphatase n=1 Tax=Synchytrium endobioticum TaxID=286115 RepID=A0A507CQP5_9FUNG|nr:hypothetical protein SeMB42_g07827 [Synchytrium endobioticum]TPX41408.1 hypothetical protein SeLEV6574_g06104 [Synchytrium endobioticum]
MASMARGHSKDSAAPAAPRLPNMPSLIEFGRLRFLVFDAPTEKTLESYAAEMERHGVTDVVRVCEPTYEKVELEKRGIRVHDLPFTDGEAPPASVVNTWLDLVQGRFGLDGKKAAAHGAVAAAANGSGAGAGLGPCLGVHCVAGLGRAPVLVAMALIEFGMNPLDSVIFIRERRKGAINARQLKFIENYRRRTKEKSCIIC